MKATHNFTLTITLLFFVFTIQAQRIIPKKIGTPKSKATRSISIEGVSPKTAMLILEIKDLDFNLKSNDSITKVLEDKYLFEKISNEYYVPAFIKPNDINTLINNGVKIGTKTKSFTTCLIPIKKLIQLATNNSLSYIQITDKVNLTLDNARAKTFVNQVHSGSSGLHTSYSGKDVVIGIIDNGFDYTHPSFYNEAYNQYRVKRVWEQNANNGTPPSGYSYGRQLTGQSILSAQTDNSSGSHGSHVAGTAAGSGSGTDGKYRGVGYESDIVLVSFSSITGVAEGIEYIYNYANSVGKPCVINMSLGSHVGSHDGNSPFDQISSDLQGIGKLLVGSAGNEGSDPLFIGKTFSGNDTLMYSFVKFPMSSNGSTNGSTVIDLWGNPNQNFYVSVNIFNTDDGTFEDWTPYISATSSSTQEYILTDDDSFFPDECKVSIGTEINPNNNKPHILVQIDNTDQDDDYRWVFLEVIGYNTNAKMWAATNSAYFTDNGFTGGATINGSTNSTIGEIGGTGKRIVTVGAYTTKNTYNNRSGNTQYIPYYETIGEIAPFSSHGPTADNRTKPDITAPGNVIIAPVNHYDSEYSGSSDKVESGITDGTTSWYFGAMQGTSMSAPMVTGILSLWLEADPNLTPEKAKAYLKSSAIKDSYTGNIPSNGNNTWGWGKVNALNGLKEIEEDLHVAIAENSNETFSFYPNPNTGKFTIVTSVSNGLITITDISGRLIKEEKIYRNSTQLDISDKPSGIYVIQISNKEFVSSQKLIKR